LDPLVISGRRDRVVRAKDHLWKLPHQSTPSLAYSGSLNIAAEVSLNGPYAKRDKRRDWQQQ
jgi:hypothetical protein